MWYKAVPLWVLTVLTVLVPAQSSPPVITNFLQKDLVNPEDVKSQAKVGFRLPCKATGSNLKWIWKHNGTAIAAYDDRPFTLSEDGTLTGSYLRAAHSGTYQCFVKDEQTGAVVFSRKLKVAVTVVGAFINPTTSVVKKVNLGESFSYDCPPHEYSYGVVYSWGNVHGDAQLNFARNERRSISSNGTLFIMYLTQEDIDKIDEYKGIGCTISGANSFQRSGTLKLEKIDKDQQDSENSTLPVWFVTPSAEETAVQGRNKTLFCFASGRPSPTITWKKDGESIQHEESSFKISPSFYRRRLSIQNVDKELHEGTYTCEAQNALNTENPISFNFRLNVEVPPEWAADPPPKNITIVIEKDGTLECKVTAKPPAEVSWYKNGQLLQSSEHHILDGSSLHLINVHLNDSGVYQCVAVNAHGMIISATWINVAAWKPSFANVQFGPFRLLNEQEAKLPCEPSTGAPAPTYKWFKNDELLTYDEGSRYRLEMDGTLVIKEVDKDQDNVNYTCKAKNFRGEDSVTTVPIILVPPSLTSTPADQKVLESATATFHCNATGNPAPKIRWIRDGKTVGEEPTLSFETNRNNSGKYWCLAENGLFSTVNASANLDVQFSPSLTTRPSNKTVLEAANVTFHCNAIGNPVPNISWIKDGEPVALGDTLSIINSKRNQSGKYWCLAENGLNLTANASADLDVQYFPSFSNVPVDQKINETDTATFQCTAIGNPSPKITWLKDGKAVATGNTFSFEANRTHSGKYWCSADNGLKTAINASAYLNVQFPASLETKPTNQTTMENQEVTFHCTATGNPTPNITWVKDGETMALGEVLNFKANRSDSGKYWCSASNGLDRTVNTSAYLDVRFPPSLTSTPADQKVLESATATFHCNATGNPAPKIRWIRDGKTVGEEPTLSFETNRNNSGKYWCLAENGLFSTVNASANLDVQFSPSLTTKPSDKTVLEAANVSFHCNAIGNPVPNISWIKDGEPVALGDTLSIINSKRNQSGKYWCLAENGLNLTANASADLDVQYFPSFLNVPVNQTINETDTATLKCTAIGNPSPKITWLKDGKAVATGNTFSFEANRTHSGKYWCSAENGLKTAINASAYLDVHFAPSLTTRPSNITIDEDDEAEFQCIATGNPTPKITWINKSGKTVGTGETLTFRANRTDSGKYLCLADNGFKTTVNASAYLNVLFPPSFTAKADNKTVKEFDEVIFHCTATGNPVPKVTWMKNGRTAAEGGTLRFTALRNDSGLYSCFVNNGLNVTIKAKTFLDVQFPPSIVTEPSNRTVVENQQATFHCSATGNPTPVITWIRDLETLIQGDTLTFKVNRNQSGKYWCSADNGLNITVNASANLSVLFSPSLITKPSNKTVLEAANVSFHCNAIGNPVPKISWIKDGEAVASGDTLRIINSKRNQSGKYWCLAENGLNLTANASADLDVQYFPSFLNVPVNQTINETDTATLQCTAIGNPSPKITWLKDGKAVATGNTFSFEANRTHSGKYWCSAENGLKTAINASAYLNVHFAPSLSTRPSNITIDEDDEAEFQCIATGNPTPKITWINKSGKTVGTGETLTFRANRTDSGKYLCLADNGFKTTVNASAYLNVLFPPSFTAKADNKTVKEFDEVIFHCTATGNPVPKVTWMKNGGTAAEGGTLRFTALRNDSGLYSCFVNNGLNVTIKAKTFLDVQFPPSIVTEPSNRTVVENQQATFHCSATGNPTPVITWIRDSETLIQGDTLTFKVNRNQSGKYWCSADNGLNITVNASANLNVLFSPSLATKPSNKTVLEAANVTFHCNVIGNPVPKISWIKDGEPVALGDTLSIINSKRNQSGKYWCLAENGLNLTANASADLDVQYFPSFSNVPVNQTINETDTATFQCTAIGNPSPKITWLKDGKAVATGNTLSFEANRTHSGKYWCSAENGLKTAINTSAYLNVQFAPSLSTRPSNITIDEVDEAEFQCIATGNPTPKITWLNKSGKTVGTGKTLTFRANRTDSGKYLCLADNGFKTTVNASAYLNVLFPPSFTAKADNKTVKEFDEVIFHCTATGNPVPKVTWMKNGRTAAEGGTLRFTALRNDSGLYSCLVDNGLNVTIKAKTFLDVQFPPSIVIEPSNRTVVENQQAAFHCSATGNPTPVITWIRDSETLNQGDTLTFKVNRNQSGKYWCSADNGLNITVNASANLSVLFSPSLTTRPSDKTVLEAANVTFHCNAIGNPVPKISWIKDGEPVALGDTLSIINSKRNQSGKYWCLAENGLNLTANASADLDVQYFPSFSNVPVNQTINETDTATFRCTAIGKPTPKITWLKDGKAVATGNTFSFEANRTHSGKYWCSAENGLKTAINASAYLNVQFAPSLTTRPSNITIDEDDEAEFQCIATGNPTPKITWINKSGKTVGTGETLTFRANRTDSGKYLCLADNGFKTTVNASAYLNVLFPPSFTAKADNKTVKEFDEVIFHCTATGNPVPKVTWMKNGRTAAEGGTLRFTALRNDSGLYSCLVDNGLNVTIKAKTFLDVQFPPSIVTEPFDRTVVENQQATFHCSATGNPTPVITWIRDLETLIQGDTLTFKVNRNQSGKYWCSVDNGLNITVNASANLSVLFSPSLTTRPSDKTVLEAANVTFHCNAIGNPVPKISWIKDGETVASGDTLRIINSQRNQSGKYWCLAENGLNLTANASADLDVQYFSSFLNVPVNQTINEGDRAKFQCTAIGNPSPKITWLKDGKAVTTGNTLSFEANRTHSGKYWCSAENGLKTAVNASAYLNVQFAPSLTTRPSNITIDEDDEAEFQCIATGNPIPKISWINESGKTVGTGETLTLKANRTDSGKYLCLADNGFKTTVNASAYLNVLFPPSFTAKADNKTVKEFDEVIFHCTATGNPVPKVTWMKNGRTAAEGGTLRFTALRNDSGLYSCLVDNGLNVTIKAKTFLDVQFPPSCRVPLTNQTVIEGNIATFHCDAKGNPAPKITWMKDGITVGQGNTLSFEANRNQSGYYWCFAQNAFNTTANASSYLDVYFKPERTHLSVDADITNAVKFDSSVKFNCTADSHPGVDEYRFYRDQSLLGSNNTGIYHLQLQRSGSYSCVPVNSAGSGEKATLYIAVKAWKPFFLGVGYGTFYLFKESLARLPCKPLGEPQPSVKWLKDGTAVSSGQNSSYKVEADGTLVITKVTDGDGGTYTCMAQNYLGIANATAPGILLERTKIVVKPQNRTVIKGTRVSLSCNATADPSLELKYIWKKDGADITSVSNVQMLEKGSVIIIPDITADEAGVYTCIVFTPDPKGSEDTASAIVSIQGSPSPPRDLQITDCYNRKTNLSWSPVVSNDTSVTHYLIDQESNRNASVFKLVYNVSSPNITSVTLNLPGWATLRFRIRAVSSFGPSRPSLPTAEGICTTSVGIPEKYPANLRGVPVKANELSITWTPMPMEDWNAPGTYYILKYRKVNGNLQDWIEEKIGDSKVGVFALSNPGYYQLWEFTIKAGNHEGLGPVSPVIRSYSGQDPPAVKPESTQVGTVTDSNVTLFWEPVVVNQGSVDGYKIYYWGESRSVDVRRKRRDLPSSADSLEVLGGNTRQATLRGLKPFTNYNVVVKAFNSAGEGPESATMSFETLEGVPGPPSNVQIIPFGEYLLITWTPPKEPNGIITNYQVGSAEYSAVSPESVTVTMKTVDPNVFKKLLSNERFETSYVVELRARTSKGWGASSRTTTRTMKKSAPAKPEKPTVVVAGEPAAFIVTYNFGVGGGYTHEFKVLYRKKGEGEQFQETAWVDHFLRQSTVINDLDFAALYEIKTIGKNTVGTSPDSNITEAFVGGNPVVGKAVGSPMYESDWFITLIILSGCVFFLLIIVVLVKRRRRRRSLNFRVAEHEKETKNKKERKIEIPAPVDLKPREDWRGRLEEADRESHDSLDEYGKTDAHFTEDGSFIGEINIDKEPSQEEVQHPVV